MLLRMIDKLPSRFTLSMAGLGFALLLAEGILRLVPPLGPEFILAGTTQSIDNRIFQDDVGLRVVLAPNVNVTGFTTNAPGIRGPQIGPKPAGSTRILAVGDSFTLGLQVTDEATFPALLDQRLGPTVDVYNAGVPGYGTAQATEQMKRLVPRVDADVVLLTVYTGNDFRDNQNWAKAPGLPTTPPPVQAPPPQPPRWISSMAPYSRIIANILLFSSLKNRETDFRLAEFRDEMLPFVDLDQLNQLTPPTKTAMQRFASACTSLGVQCAVIIVPPAFVVHTERVERTFTAFGLDHRQAQLDAPQSIMARMVPTNIPVLDLTPTLRENEHRRPYLVFDPHFSSNGHLVTAEALLPFIRELVAKR